MPSIPSSIPSQPLINTKRAQVALWELDHKTDTLATDVPNPLVLQYFPETLSDNKAVNYQQKEIAGGSLPLYQWAASGERTISFTAMLSCDVDFYLVENLAIENVQKGKVVSQATNYSARQLHDVLQRQDADHNVDIRAAIVALRRFMLPIYDSGESLRYYTYAPRKLRLEIPNSGIGLYGGDDGGEQGAAHPHSVVCIMTTCDVTIEAFFPSGLPKLASVSLAFAQVAQIGGRVRFPGHTEELRKAVDGSSPYIFGYNRPKKVGSGSGDEGGDTPRLE